MACYRDSFELQDLACTVLVTLPPLSDELAEIVLPGVITAVQAHPQGRVQSVGYGFLVKYKHIRTAFDECEGGTEVYGIAVSCASSCLLRLMLIRNGQRCGAIIAVFAFSVYTKGDDSVLSLARLLLTTDMLLSFLAQQ